MVLVVHTSNFRIRGFTETPSLASLSAGIPDGVILAVDQGSGTTTERIGDETAVRRYLKDGADLVCFSGDKVLGGPQAGIVVGRQDLLQHMAAHPLVRVLRSGKTIRSLMEEHLIRKLNGESGGQVERVVARSLADLEKLGNSLQTKIASNHCRPVTSTYAVGGGSVPDQEFPSVSLELDPRGNPEDLLARLRDWDPPIIATISGGRVLLNLASINPSETHEVVSALQTLLGGE
jgi:L-seryl-tRNA(Ser) seleniumtransferase